MTTTTKYTVKVWYRSNGLTAMSILLNTSNEAVAAEMYMSLAKVFNDMAMGCALETSMKMHKEMHRAE